MTYNITIVMGGSVSTKVKDKASMDVMVGLILPASYTKASITCSELTVLKETWGIIERNQSNFFFEFQNQLKKVGVCPPHTCSEYLLSTWIQRLLDIHPDVKLVLHKIDTNKLKTQLPSTMTLLIDCVVDNPAMFQSIVQGVATSLRALNIRSCEISTGVDAMIYSLKRCLGPKICNPDIIHIFMKLFSRMLEILIPLSIQSELTDNI